jgi:serine/threonine-protein kinase
MAPAEAYDVVEKVCDALMAAHAVGVVHRDLKAENVLIGFDHGVKLVDFGLAKLIEPDPELPSLTTTREVLGTVTAMAPEQIRGGTIDARTDIYASA